MTKDNHEEIKGIHANHIFNTLNGRRKETDFKKSMVNNDIQVKVIRTRIL